MGDIRSIADREGAQASDGLAADRRMALLAQAFEIELAEAEPDREGAWPMGQTMWLAVVISSALWALIYIIIRLI
jgi:hypothetical protein